MQTLKVPKRIPIDMMRQILGDQRTEDFLTAAYGPKLLGGAVISVRKEAFEHMLAWMEGTPIEGMKPTSYQQAIPAIFRLYFRESPKAKTRFVLWLRRHLEENTAGAAEQITQDVLSRTPKQRKRRAQKAVAKSRK